MQALRAILVVFLLALAGCAGKGKDDKADDAGASGGTSSSGSPGAGGATSSSKAPGASAGSTSTGSTSSAPGSGGNIAPSAVLAASVVTGAAPLAVLFNITGSDPDGDALTWTLDVDGNGTADYDGTDLPSEVNHTFTAGLHVVNLTVSDGTDTALASVTVNVTAGAGTGPRQVVDGSYVVPAEGCPATGYDLAELDPLADAGGELDGVVRVQFAVDALTIGLPYSAAFTFDAGYLYVGANFYDGDDALLSSENTGQSPNFGGITLAGTVPAAAAKAVLFACGGPTEGAVHYEA